MVNTREEQIKNWEKRCKGDLSPTQINTLFKCPKGYYYKYIEKLKEAPSIHLIKGIAVHHSLEKIFEGKLNPTKTVKEQLLEKGERHYKERWKIGFLGLSPADAKMHYDDGMMMITAFVERLAYQIDILIKVGKVRDMYHGINLLKPKFQEVRYKEPKLGIMGMIDQVNTDFDDNVTLVDLKTSSKFRNNIPEDYERQMAIYAYMYSEIEKELPKWVCINYLRYGESFYIRVTDDFVRWGAAEIKRARNFICESNFKKHYYKKESALCPYCAFREQCGKDSDAERAIKSIEIKKTEEDKIEDGNTDK